MDLSAKLYDYLVSISFGEVPVGSLEQCDVSHLMWELTVHSAYALN